MSTQSYCDTCGRPMPEWLEMGDPCMERSCKGYFAPTAFQSFMLGEGMVARPTSEAGKINIALPGGLDELNAIINRRAEVEQYLLDCARGKRPLPDGGTCRKLALRLGTPKEQWSEVLREDAPAGITPAAAINMLLFCPACKKQHIDAPEAAQYEYVDGIAVACTAPAWDNPPHRTHQCNGCGHLWRPADVPTNGVEFIATAPTVISDPAACAAGRRVRHKKRGTAYQVLLEAELQAGAPVVEGAILKVYMGEDGKPWARPVPEFEDGRFEDLP